MHEHRDTSTVDTSHVASVHIPFFVNDTATTEIYTLSLHDALPISSTNEARMRLSARVRSGGESRMTNAYSDFADTRNAPILFEDRSSAGFGGTGPQSRRSSPGDPEGRTASRQSCWPVR